MKTLFFVCSVIVSVTDLANSHEPCLTPNNTSGFCIPLRDCKELYNIVLNIKKSTKTERDLVKRSHCVSMGHIPPMVCCEGFVIESSTFESKISATTQLPQAKILLPFPGECGTEVKERILGGKRAQFTEFPWMALILYSQRRRKFAFLCGGSLINKDYVLTAAHCVKGRKIMKNEWEPYSIRLGENDIRSNPDCEGKDCADPVVDVPISELIIHDEYIPASHNSYNDIALIRLSHSVGTTDFIRPVCLPLADHLRDKNFDTKWLEVIGFGRIENGTTSNVKLKLEIMGFNWNNCNDIYQQKANVSLISNQMCAGGEAKKGTCTGDSGSPLTAVDTTDRRFPYTYLVAILSRGPPNCGMRGVPSIFTRVDKYLDWIVDHMRE